MFLLSSLLFLVASDLEESATVAPGSQQSGEVESDDATAPPSEASERTCPPQIPDCNDAVGGVPVAVRVEGTAVVLDANGDGAVDVQWSKVEVKRFPQPKMPREAKEYGIAASCPMRLYIDERGNVYEVQLLDDCPVIFHESATKAGMKAKFKPMIVNGEAQKATFVVIIHYGHRSPEPTVEELQELQAPLF